MENNSYDYSKYLKMVWKKAFQETIRLYRTDWRTTISNIATASFTVLVLYVWRGQTIALDEGSLAIAGLVGFICGFFVVFFINLLIVVPTRVFIDKDKEASKYNWDYVEIDIIQFDEDSEFGLGLLFTNKKPYDMHNFSVSLDSLLDVMTKTPIAIDKSSNRLPFVKQNKTRTWSPKKFAREGGKRTVELILWNDFEAWFQTDEPAELKRQTHEPGSKAHPDLRVRISNSGAYSFLLVINGQVDGHDLPPGHWEGRLLLNQGKIRLSKKPTDE